MTQNRDAAARPISPHLQIYRPTLLMVMSILHRITGAINASGTVLVVWWLVALASGPQAYATFQWAAASPLGLLVLFGYTWSVMHHMMGGVRHLIWDTGASMAPAQAKRLAAAGIAAALVLTVVIWGAAAAAWFAMRG